MTNIIRGLTKEDILMNKEFNHSTIKKLLGIDMSKPIPNEIMQKIENCRTIILQTSNAEFIILKLRSKNIDFETTEFTQVSSIYDIGDNITDGDFIITTNKSQYELLDDNFKLSNDDVVRLNNLQIYNVVHYYMNENIEPVSKRIYFTYNLLIKSTDNKYIVIKGCDDVSNLDYKTIYQLSELPNSIDNAIDNLCYILEVDRSLAELSKLYTIKPEHLYTSPIITSEQKKFN